LVEVIKLFEQIQNTSNLNDKQAIIIANKNNELFKKCLKFLLDSNVITGISDKKINKDVDLNLSGINILRTFEDVMKYLENNNTGSDISLYRIQCFLKEQPEEYREFYKQMITKKFRLGANVKLVNKCIPNLIPVFNLMLGKSIEEVNLKGHEKIFISKKLNGTRCAFVDNKLMTRQGKIYQGLDHILADLCLLDANDMFIDGELVYKNQEGLSDSSAFQKGTGIAMSKNKDKTSLKLTIFDVFPLNEFWSGKSGLTYEKRKGEYILNLKRRIKELNLVNLDVVEMCYEGFDHNKIWEWLNYAEQHDWEGIIINLDTPYECKRTKNLIKVKEFKEIDLRCVAVNIAESGKYNGKMKSITCKYGDFNVDIGSGFSDYHRKYYMAHPEEIENHVVAIKYKEETINKNGGKSLQFPIFISCRSYDDKNIADDEN